MSPQQRGFKFIVYEKQSRTIHLQPTHPTLNDVLHALKVEYMKKDEQPFSKFINKQYLLITKSKTTVAKDSEIILMKSMTSKVGDNGIEDQDSRNVTKIGDGRQTIVKSGSTVIAKDA